MSGRARCQLRPRRRRPPLASAPIRNGYRGGPAGTGGHDGADHDRDAARDVPDGHGLAEQEGGGADAERELQVEHGADPPRLEPGQLVAVQQQGHRGARDPKVQEERQRDRRRQPPPPRGLLGGRGRQEKAGAGPEATDQRGQPVAGEGPAPDDNGERQRRRREEEEGGAQERSAAGIQGAAAPEQDEGGDPAQGEPEGGQAPAVERLAEDPPARPV